jgi:hypothetical protein
MVAFLHPTVADAAGVNGLELECRHGPIIPAG